MATNIKKTRSLRLGLGVSMILFPLIYIAEKLVQSTITEIRQYLSNATSNTNIIQTPALQQAERFMFESSMTFDGAKPNRPVASDGILAEEFKVKKENLDGSYDGERAGYVELGAIPKKL